MIEPGLRHRFVPAGDASLRPLLLLHGTGGNEDDLLPLGRALSPGAALLSPRGAVSEGGAARFFRRLAEGVFDEDDLRRRAGELAGFVAEARARHGLGAPVAVGFSNGANIAAALMLLWPGVLAGAVLLRAMTPLRTTAAWRPPVGVLEDAPVLLLSGAADPMVAPADAARLASQLAAAGGRVEHRTVPAGHGLSQADVDIAAEWMREHGR